ncbi:MAG: M23 family metallopeptidase [Candidatus Dojkabacteria bacterium]|nr:M23 family metallopeptidase [Candidatus Dojkabacteria bacterium]
METILRILFSFITPIYAHTDIQLFDSSPVLIQWQAYGEDYEYMVKVYDDSSQELVLYSDWIDENSFEVELNDEALYLWELYIKEKEKNCSDEHQCLNIESGYFYLSIDQQTESIVEEITKEDANISGNTEKAEEKKEQSEKSVLGITEKSSSNKESDVITEVIENIENEDLKENFCIYKYNMNKKQFILENCDIDIPQVLSSTYQKYGDEYIVKSNGEYIDSITVKIDTVSCKNFDILDTTTWFKCNEVFIRSDEYTDVKLSYQIYFLDSKIIPPSNYLFGDNNFEIYAVTNTLPTNLLAKGYFSLNPNSKWLDQEMSIKLATEFKEIESSTNGIYSFPFNKIVYVNQWHGCTDYQCPHKGIDFAAVREYIYASDNGIVVAKGYDTYSGECNSGGNYVLVKYDSGHYMSYMHLEKDYVSTGQKVKKGDLIALSGNSGSCNCQPLGYHLHFELREERSQSTHIDPVPFINIDWNLVKTNKSNIYPKRLSGDNPHPNF